MLAGARPRTHAAKLKPPTCQAGIVAGQFGINENICILVTSIDNAMKLKYFAAALLLVLGVGCSQDRKGTLDLKSEEDLTGLTVSVSAGSYYQSRFSGREDITLFVTNAEADGIQAVRQGTADVYVSDEVMLTKDDMARLGIKMAFRGEECFDVAFAIRKGDEAFRSRFNAFLSSAPLKEIIAYWLEGGPEVEEPPYEISPDAPPLSCICCVNMSPISFLGDGGEWTGLDIDILRRFAHSMGRTLEVNLQELASAIIALQTGQCDVLSGSLFTTEERKTAVDFTIPYHKCHPGYFVADKSVKHRLGVGERLKMNLLKEKRWKLIVNGLLETLKITLLSILLGTILGIGVCACRRSHRAWLRSLAKLYGELINGIPTLVLLLIMFYVVFANAGLNASLVAIITFALTFASSAGSIFDNAISSVPRGQTEAGLALGFTRMKTFNGIVFPQALKIGLPLYTGQCVALLKSTSIVGYIAIQDLTRASDLIRSRTFDAFIPLLIVTVMYFILAWIIRKLLNLFLLKK